MQRLSILVATISLTLLGCGGQEKVPRVAVSGKISSSETFESKGLGLSFTHSNGYDSTTIVANADGTFSGEAAVGTNTVSLFGAPVEGGSGHAAPETTNIDPSFWNASSSPWKVTVAAEGSPDIQLSLDAPVAGVGASSHGVAN